MYDFKMYRKIVASVIGILVLLGIVIFSIQSIEEIKNPIGEYISVEEAMNMSIALITLHNDSMSKDRSLLYEEILGSNVRIDDFDYLTYEMYLEIINYLSEDIWFIAYENEISAQEDYQDFLQAIIAMTENKYELSHSFLKEDWYVFYDLFREEFGYSSVVYDRSVEVWGIGDMVTLQEGEALEHNQVLTSEGVFEYATSVLDEVLYRKVTVTIANNEILAVRNIDENEMQFQNIWIMEVNENSILCFIEEISNKDIYADGDSISSQSEEEEYSFEVIFPIDNNVTAKREQVADVQFFDGNISGIKSKEDKISGKILNIREDTIEIEGVGNYSYSENIKIYKLYGSLKMCTLEEIRIGYAFSDFVIENGEIVAALIVKDEAMEYIRVLLKTANFADYVHEEVVFSSDCDLLVSYGENNNESSVVISAGEEMRINTNSEYFTGSRIVITPTALTGRIAINSINRNSGIPSYRGTLELEKTADGIVIVNELLLEEYLYGVVPSEMPASYPEEALKSQAICARTYAYGNMINAGLAEYGAHVDDSTGYQVYNNISEQVETTKAIKETSGQILKYDGEIINTYYYSTSCGFGTTTDAWTQGSANEFSYLLSRNIGTGESVINHTESDFVNDSSSVTESEVLGGDFLQEEETFALYISKVWESDFERNEPWYRWKYEVDSIDVDGVITALQQRYEANNGRILTEDEDGQYGSIPIENMGNIRNIVVAKRTAGGAIEEMIIEFEEGRVKIISELNVRYVLADSSYEIMRQDGTSVAITSLLPSAFFTIETQKEGLEITGYELVGGGYGHGIGMSQNAAKAMAELEYDADGILHFFYQGSDIVDIYKEDI
ncbi:MAG: SpoIID/LytB domain-containing protein [Eubacteriales bacterium]